jgi:hypothetical protein
VPNGCLTYRRFTDVIQCDVGGQSIGRCRCFCHPLKSETTINRTPTEADALVLALGLIALGVAIALVTECHLKDRGEAPTEAEKKKPRQTGGHWAGLLRFLLGGNLSDGRGISTITAIGIACVLLNLA